MREWDTHAYTSPVDCQEDTKSGNTVNFKRSARQLNVLHTSIQLNSRPLEPMFNEKKYYSRSDSIKINKQQWN